MKIKRFDSIELNTLICGERGGYYPDGTDEGERAKLLMIEGVFNKNPVKNWQKNGYAGFTEYGKKYYAAFMKRIAQKHGHVWETNRDTNPDLYDEDDEHGKKINAFAYSSGYHNGMVCKKCGFSFCRHCESEFEIPKCTK